MTGCASFAGVLRACRQTVEFATGRPFESLTDPCNVAAPACPDCESTDCPRIAAAPNNMINANMKAARRKWLAVKRKRPIGQAQVAESIGVKLAR